jgi:hypothetical protein
MNRHEFLTGLHALLTPRAYLEIGVNTGKGLALSRTRTIGVDPAFRIRKELACDLQLVLATSDDFFARPDAMAWFPEGVVDLAFIDGMHLFEFALRDFINTERSCTTASVVVFDDMLPRSDAEAARDRITFAWAGDVYKVALVLERYRPDLVVLPLDTSPTGLVLVAGLDPSSTVLSDHYDDIVAEYATADPQHVADEVLHRTHAADPEKVLASSVWSDLVAARGDGSKRADVEGLRGLRGTGNFTLVPPKEEPWPPSRSRSEKPKRAAGPPPSPAQRIRRAIKRRL